LLGRRSGVELQKSGSEIAILPRYYSGREDAVRIGKDLAIAARIS